jgi:hypothetical protein
MSDLIACGSIASVMLAFKAPQLARTPNHHEVHMA